MKYIVQISLCIVFILGTLSAQVQNGIENGESSAGAGSSTTNASKSAIISNVDHFGGTYNVSHDLGTVSTSSGTSFAAKLSYSSTHTANTDEDYLTGIPYGDGWNVNVPTMTIGTDVYHKYTLQETYNINTDVENSPLTPLFNEEENCEDALREGDLYWFSPTISLPGLGSHKLVFAPKEKSAPPAEEQVAQIIQSSSSAAAPVISSKWNRFIPQNFQTFFEVYINESFAVAVMNDGTTYILEGLGNVTYRQAANQRYQTDCVDQLNPPHPRDLVKNMFLPKPQTTVFYCTNIYNPSKTTEQDGDGTSDLITFDYEKYGPLDYNSHLNEKSRAVLQYFNGGAISYDKWPITYEKVILQEISSDIEKVVLDYDYLTHKPEGSDIVLYAGHNNNIDDIYVEETKEIWKFNNNNDLKSWKRYVHVKSSGLTNYGSNDPVMQLGNPYIGSVSGDIPSLFRNDDINSASFNEKFNDDEYESGYLESPALSFSDFTQGCEYKIKLKAGNLFDLDGVVLMDFNIVTGTSDVEDAIESSPATFRGDRYKKINSKCYQYGINQSIHSTFRNGIKHLLSRGYSQGEGDISETFRLSNLSPEFANFRIQVGPANSDTQYDFDVCGLGTGIGSTYYTNRSDSNLELVPGALYSGHSVNNNFGVGLSWYALQQMYRTMSSDILGVPNFPTSQASWWANPSCGMPNKPVTDAIVSGDEVHPQIQQIELVRIAKMPWVLKTTTKYIKNDLGNWVVQNRYGYKHDYRSANHLTTTNYFDGVNEVNSENVRGVNGMRHIIVLEKIKRLPSNVNSTYENTPDTYPTDHFNYEPQLFYEDEIGSGQAANFYVINEHINPLGRNEKIEYYTADILGELGNDENSTYAWLNTYTTTRYWLAPNPLDNDLNECFGLCPNGSLKIKRLGTPLSLSIHMVVKNKIVEDANGPQQTSYDFTGSSVHANYDYLGSHFKHNGGRVGAIEGGFSSCVVTMPGVNGNPAPIAKYSFEVQNKNMFGKLKSIQNFSGSTLISETINEYDNVRIYKVPDDYEQHELVDFNSEYYYEGAKYHTWRFLPNGSNAKDLVSSSFFTRLNKTTTKTPYGNGYVESITEYKYYECDEELDVSNVDAFADLEGSNTQLSDFPSFTAYEIKKSLSSSVRSCDVHPSIVTSKIYNHYDNYLSGANSDIGVQVFNFGLKSLPYMVVNESKRNDTYKSAVFYSYDENNFLLKEERVSNSQVIDPANSILKSDYLEYDFQFRKPTRVKDIAGRIASTLYNSNGTPQYTNIEDVNGLAFMTSYTYNSTNALVDEVTDPNGIIIKTTYDDLNRPDQTFRNGRLLTDVDYSNWDNSEKSFEEKANQNYVSTKTIIDNNLEFTSKSLIDPLGRNVASVIDQTDVVSNTIYDFYGRAIEVVRPHASNPILAYTNSDDNVNTMYKAYPNNQVEEVATYTHGLGGSNNESFVYDIVSDQEMASHITNAGNTYIPKYMGCAVLKEEYRDNDNKLTTTYRDLTGATLAVIRPIDGNNSAATTFQLDERNNITLVSNPKSQQTTYKFNYLNQLYQKNSLDKGEEKFGYDHLSNLIAYSSNGNVDLYHYDNHGRNVIHGKGTTNSFFNNEGARWLTNNETYQAISNDVFSSLTNLFSSYHYEEISTAVNVPPNIHQLLANNDVGLNRLSQTISYNESNRPVETKFFGYDTDGFVAWDANLMNYNGISSSPGFAFMTQYRYTVNGLVKEKYVDLNVDFTLDFGCTSIYDNRGRLKSITPRYIHSGSTQNLVTPLASYDYDDLTNLVKSITFAGTANYNGLKNCPNRCIDEIVDVINFNYDPKYRLASIISNDYVEALYYDNSMPQGMNGNPNWNGNINGVHHRYVLPQQGDFGMFSNLATIRSEVYEYDELNRLTNTDSYRLNDPNYPSLNWGIVGDNNYQYDKIGNLLRLTRNEISDQFTNELLVNGYTYNTQNNKLQSINSNSSLNGSDVWNYTYNQDGNIVSDDHRDVGSIDYYRQILPSKINLNIQSSIAPNIQYIYNSADSRIVKRTDVSSLGAEVLEYYLKDASGQEMGIYDVNSDKLVWYIYGDRMLASIDHTGAIQCDNPILTDDPSDPTGGGGLGTGFGGSFTPKFYNAITLADSDIDPSNASNQMILSAITDIITNDNGEVVYDLPTTLIKYEENGVSNISVDESILQDPRYTILDTLPILSPSQSISLTDRDGVVVQKRLYEVLTPNTNKLDYSYYASNVAPFGSSEGHVMESLAGAGSGPTQYTVPPAAAYYIQDHLGNTRVKYDLICEDGQMNRRILELHDYHPFGKTMRSYSFDEEERYLFTGKERDAKIGYDYFGARYYDSDVGRFMSVDPLADQFAGYSPYNYVLNNPIRMVDPDGRAPEDIILLFYVSGNKKGDESFRAAMETRRNNIMNSPNFNSEKDIVLSFGIESLSEIKSISQNASSTYGDQFGKVSELGVWSHSGYDGPVGSDNASEGDALSEGSSQMSLEGWNNTNIDWDKSASCSFYGCNSASGGETSFAAKVSGLDSFRGVKVSGQNGSAYPSFSPTERATNLTRNYFPSKGFSIGSTYYVGGSYGNGFRSMWFTGNNPEANKMSNFMNGFGYGSSHQKSWY